MAKAKRKAEGAPAAEHQPQKKQLKHKAKQQPKQQQEEAKQQHQQPRGQQAKAAVAQQPAAGGNENGHASARSKEKVLVLSTRGITFRFRHLMTDLQALLPHSKKDNKLDTKHDRGVINEVADMKGCSCVIFFEVRKRQDLYLWIGKAPDGPCVKFLVQNVHTMAELKLTGNHLKGSRPVLSFDANFDNQPHFQLLKELLTQVFATPRRHHKAKPFFDHVLSFTVADDRIWMRNYQVVMPLDKKKADASNATLVEVGPRMCLQPIKIFAGSFGGQTLYDNPAYTSPNTVRAAIKRARAGQYKQKVAQKAKRRQHEAQHPPVRGELDDVFAG